MKTLKTGLLLIVTLAASSVGPLIFPAAQAGHGTMAQSAKYFLLPAVAVLIFVLFLSWKSVSAIGRSIVWGGLAGAIATIGLEIVRFTGFRMGYMPGNLPRLMGVLLLDRFALGPSAASDVAGWVYHFWNGASFGIIYVLLFGAARRWVGVLYGISVGLGFLVSPAVISLGVGYFGLQFSKGFPMTVLSAHLAFGLVLGVLANRFLPLEQSSFLAALRSSLAFEFRACNPATFLGNRGRSCTAVAAERQLKLRKKRKTSATNPEKKRLTLDHAPRCSFVGGAKAMQIGIVAEKIGLSVGAIRLYARNGLLPRVSNTAQD